MFRSLGVARIENAIYPFLLPVALLLIVILRRAPKTKSATSSHPYFKQKVLESIHGPVSPSVSYSERDSVDYGDYNYDVRGRATYEII